MASARSCLRTDFAGKTREKTTSHKRRTEMKNRFGLGVLAYLVPTFALGFVWHLILFKQYYEDLAIYRKDIIIPFGFLSMMVQAFLFVWMYRQVFAPRNGSLLARGLLYAAFGAVLSWSFTTLAVAAKNTMTSVPHYLVIETAFTVVQWILVGPLTAFVYANSVRKDS
jgi:ABC-type sugar transport system permease subunit